MTALIGSLTAGANNDFFATGDIAVTSYVCSASGTLDTMSVVITLSAFTSLKLVIYADSAGAPGALLGQTVTTSSVTAGQKDLAMASNISLTSGTTYWLGVAPLGGDLNIQEGAGGYKGNSGNASPPNPFGTVAFQDNWNLPIAGTGSTGGGSTIVSPLQSFGPSYAAHRAASI